MNAHQRIGILSDTHGYIDDQICKALATCDLIFHAGDIGSPQVLERLQAIAPTLAVYGNIDDAALHAQLPEVVHTEVAGVELVMIHIGGYPGHYERAFAPYLTPWRERPMITISGHSHILKVMPDKSRPGLLHINPGAVGRSGWHQSRTLIRLQITSGRPHDLEVIEWPR
ncbi:metallophosphoesterase family protein [Porphyromonas sp.]|uniref:metallophosphoesterase family protein n=1 Tax=Porphyromonas sp. TaxID=1924944 RepID=UPI0039913C5C